MIDSFQLGFVHIAFFDGAPISPAVDCEDSYMVFECARVVLQKSVMLHSFVSIFL